MNKYIIKNCPAWQGCGCFCKNTTSCLPKKIVSLCKDGINKFYAQECDEFLGESNMAQQILELLEMDPRQ